MRKYVTPFLSALMMVGAVIAVSGCQASASIGSGAKTTEQPPAEKPAEKPAEPKPAEKQPDFQVENGRLVLPGPVTFETGKDILKPESDEVLTFVKKYLEAKPKITLLRIEGHTDSDGDDKANQTLSELRSLAVARWLVAKGVDCKRLMPVGFGESKPVAANDTAENKAQNRRTAFVNAALSGNPIGGMPVDGGAKVAGDPCK